MPTFAETADRITIDELYRRGSLKWTRGGSIEVSPAEFFRTRAQVLLTDGAACGDAGRGHVRLNFATPRPILTEIVRRMAGALHDR
jgi:cysteine-S-conjugate beta-lyase